jgi:hypothetical protein
VKAFFWLSMVLVVVLFSFAGCGGTDEEALVNGDGSLLGFAGMTAGSWEELVTPEGTHERYEFLGTDTYKGTECYIMEFDTIENGKKSSTQIWLDKTTSKGVLYVMKDENGKVTKMDIPQNPTVPTDPGEAPVGATKTGTDKYTTPTGKTVDVTIYTIQTTYGTSESWISAKVPFGEVKSIFNGKVESELYDFGTSGATRDISKQEADNAQSIDIGGGDGNGDGGGDIGIGDIKITVGAGARPEIKVSSPINSLSVVSLGFGFAWGFEMPEGQTSAGPFTYGVVPKGAQIIGEANPPDLVAGSMYSIQVMDVDQNVSTSVFTR